MQPKHQIFAQWMGHDVILGCAWADLLSDCTTQALNPKHLTIVKIGKHKHNTGVEPFKIPGDEDVGETTLH